MDGVEDADVCDVEVAQLLTHRGIGEPSAAIVLIAANGNELTLSEMVGFLKTAGI